MASSGWMQPAECLKQAAELEATADVEGEADLRAARAWSPCGAHLLGNDRSIARTKSEDSGIVQIHMSGFDV